MKRLFVALAALTVGSPASPEAPSPAKPPFLLKQVGPGVYAAIDGPEHKAGSNAGFIVGDDGVLVVDAFFNIDAARELVAEIHRLTRKPIRYLVNTHYHADHTGGDQALRDAGAVIIAHKNVRGWVRVNNINLFGDRITPELKSRIQALPLPDLVTDKDLIVWLGSRKILVRTVLGHTGGDLIILVPDAKVLFAGDMLWRKVAPNLIDGSVKEWAATDFDLIAMPDAARTTYVPGHGDVADLNDVEEFRRYLLDLVGLVRAGRKAGFKDEALAADAGAKLKARYPDWTISDRAAAAEIRYVDQELAGTKKRPVPVADREVARRAKVGSPPGLLGARWPTPGVRSSPRTIRLRFSAATARKVPAPSKLSSCGTEDKFHSLMRGLPGSRWNLVQHLAFREANDRRNRRPLLCSPRAVRAHPQPPCNEQPRGCGA